MGGGDWVEQEQHGREYLPAHTEFPKQQVYTEMPAHVEVPEEHDHTYSLLRDNLGIVLTILGFAAIGVLTYFRPKIKAWLGIRQEKK